MKLVKSNTAFVWLVFCVVSLHHNLVSSKVRRYYIAAVERKWNYAPSGYNNVKGLKLGEDSDAAVFTTRGAHTIGSVYNKVLYREYTDSTFTTKKDHPKYLGFLGPILKGEEGDTLEIHFKNRASRKFSMHPHGVFYRKDSEGALYEDKTTGNDKNDDHVPPGGSHVYSWKLTNAHAPTDSDDDCLTWIYHSHVLPHKDINTGLLGIMLTCKKGALSGDGRKGVDKEFVGLFTVLDENESWLLQKNIDEFCSDPSGVKTDDEDFQESNKMHAINGYFYGNLPGLEICLGDSVKWHLAGIGNEVDIHTAYFHGQSFIIDGHRKDVASLLPATFVTASMKALNPGTWMLNCLVNDHYNAGMYALYHVTKCNGKSNYVPTVSGGKTRTYYIAANEVPWNYGPTGMNNMDGQSLTKPDSDSAVFFAQGADRIGGTYTKASYEEYTDSTFSVNKEKPKHLGFLGPVIRAEVGDVIEVVFKNNANHNYSIQPHGVFFNKSNEGALYQDRTSGAQKADDIVRPGQNYTYRWTVPEEVGPSQSDSKCITWLYYSSVDPVKDTYSGLFGPLLTCKKGSLKDDNTQKSIDKEFVLLFTVTDESASWYHEENKKRATYSNTFNDEDEDYLESNLMHGINGYLYANLPDLDVCLGDKVSWHLIGFGNEVDMHTAYFYGNTFSDNGQMKDTVSLLPGVFSTLKMTPDNPGEWAIVCRTNDHYSAGMQAKYKVNTCGKVQDKMPPGTVRQYYVAAIEEEWDYAPTGKDVLEGKPLEDSEDASTFTVNSANRIGRKYKKVLYREYTSAQFSQQKMRTEAEKHLGVLGPMLHAEVGDTIEVTFKNMARRNYSMHPHGLYYTKRNEGSDYDDDTLPGDKIDNAIHPGQIYTYKWQVPERAGPGPNGPTCVTWAYYSDVNPIKDTNSGLVGPLVVCKKNTLTATNSRSDVDHEFALLFTVLDENESWYLDENIDKYCTSPGNKDQLKGDADFQESNKMHGVNGFVFANGDGFKMYQNEKVDWYLLGMGNEVDLHTVHFHGQTFLRKHVGYHREDVYDLFPGVFATVEMIPDSVGVWLLHCHVNDHMVGGMQTLYTVYDKSTDPSAADLTARSSFIICLLLAVGVMVI
ncbi:hephaestin-like protein [Stylophora pistillata]|uniref:hephaestin-like protein n=1 Tax=Stylophora pistillata TaxID=50429 RepID=UPI000C04399A|nr:hephaestin-like protein [Stylophora pistillata]